MHEAKARLRSHHSCSQKEDKQEKKESSSKKIRRQDVPKEFPSCNEKRGSPCLEKGSPLKNQGNDPKSANRKMLLDRKGQQERSTKIDRKFRREHPLALYVAPGSEERAWGWGRMYHLGGSGSKLERTW